TATCTFTVTVSDTEKPAVTCPANISTVTDPGKCTATVTYTPTATDNCPGVTVDANPKSGTAFPVGTTPVTVTAMDAAGNTTTCSFNVIVADTEKPAVTCPANKTVTGAPPGGVNVTYAAPTATDNCPGVTVVSTPASGSLFPVGTTTVTATATDA